MAYSNSSLVTYKNLSPNHSGQRNHSIDTVTVHCIVGQWTAKQGCDFFSNSSVQASPNYIVGKDGSIGLSVEEKNRSWCTSNSANDNRAITIEVASDTKHPYAVTDKALKALIKLLADICKRNGIKKLVWSTNKNDRVNHKNGCNMTVHRDYANKSCPGDYLYNKHGYIADEVNKLLGSANKPTTSKEMYRVGSAWKNGKCVNQKGAFESLANAKAYCDKYADYSVFDSKGNKVYTSAKKDVTGSFKSYKVTITSSNGVNIRKGAGTNYAVTGSIPKGGAYTIVAESTGQGAKKWGKLKSGAGWIALDFTKKI